MRMGQAADALGRVGKNLRTLPGEGVQHATDVLRDAVTKSVSRDTGGDRRLSGLGPRGKALSVKVTQVTLGDLVVGHVMAGPPKQRAPWFWLDEGTASGHRRVRGTSRRYRGTLTTYYHPGTPAKGTWSNAVARVMPSIERHFEKLHQEALKG